jgi:hypothetical protein
MPTGNYCLGNVRTFLQDHPSAAQDHDSVLGAAAALALKNCGPFSETDIIDLLGEFWAQRFIEEVSVSAKHQEIFAKEIGCDDTVGNYGAAEVVQKHPGFVRQKHPKDETQCHPAD